MCEIAHPILRISEPCAIFDQQDSNKVLLKNVTVLLLENCAWLRKSKNRMRNFAQESQNAIRTQDRHVCRGHKERALYDHTARHIPGGLWGELSRTRSGHGVATNQKQTIQLIFLLAWATHHWAPRVCVEIAPPQKLIPPAVHLLSQAEIGILLHTP